MIGDGEVDTCWDAVGDGLALWIIAGDGWEGTSGQVGVTIGVEVDRGVSKVGWAGGGGISARGGVGCDGCGDVGVTAGVDVDREVAKTGGGKKSARDVGVLEQEPLMNLGMFDNLMTTEAIKGLT